MVRWVDGCGLVGALACAQCQIVEDVAKMIKEMESQTPEIPMGTMEQILEIARATRWQYHKYSRLRTREQFAKGKYLNRRKTIDGMFFFSKVRTLGVNSIAQTRSGQAVPTSTFVRNHQI